MLQQHLSRYLIALIVNAFIKFSILAKSFFLKLYHGYDAALYLIFCPLHPGGCDVLGINLSLVLKPTFLLTGIHWVGHTSSGYGCATELC